MSAHVVPELPKKLHILLGWALEDAKAVRAKGARLDGSMWVAFNPISFDPGLPAYLPAPADDLTNCAVCLAGALLMNRYFAPEVIAHRRLARAYPCLEEMTKESTGWYAASILLDLIRTGNVRDALYRFYDDESKKRLIEKVEEECASIDCELRDLALDKGDLMSNAPEEFFALMEHIREVLVKYDL